MQSVEGSLVNERIGGGVSALMLIIFGIMWLNGEFDHFLAQQGLAFLAKGPCIETLFGQWFCGIDEVTLWCRTLALHTPQNATVCAQYW